ncbi:MAG: hypothetical protein PVH19_10845 [Planctomycetia bacterium]|jgi:hypothetical protein
MNARRRSFIRKMIYVAAMIPLCFLLIYIGQPGTSATKTTEAKPGGKLSQIRTDNGLDQSKWGEIDPAGEAIKLATFGMRGVAANLLWGDANEAKKKKDWTKLTATLNQVMKLQPNYVKVWEFQAWNLSYNCSVEFDDYRDRYHWVIRGIEFLQDGIKYNKKKPRLYQSVGWTISQKIGRADEAEQFRVLFVEDTGFFKNHDRFYPEGGRPQSKRDNWLVGKDWYDEAASLVDDDGAILRGDSELLFRSKPPMCLMSYAEAIEREGVFGERAKKAWEDASDAWTKYGERDLLVPPGMTVRLGELGLLQKRLQKKSDELDALAPANTRKNLEKTKKSRLSDEERIALETPENLRTMKQHQLAHVAEAITQVTFDEINNAVKGENKAEANKILKEIKGLQTRITKTKSNRGIVNYSAWEARAKVEQQDRMLEARKLAYRAQKALKEGGNLDEASEAFKKSIDAWDEVLRKNQKLIYGREMVSDVNMEENTLMADNLSMTDTTLRDDLDELIENYGKLLDQEDSLFPKEFPLAGYVNSRVQQNDKWPGIAKDKDDAQKAIESQNWLLAQESLESEFRRWTFLMADIPSLMQRSDSDTADLVLEEIRKYVYVLQQQDKPFPESFPLRQFVWAMVVPTPATQNARNLGFAGNQAFLQKDYATAEKHLKQSLEMWEMILQVYPSIIGDKSFCVDMIKVINAYRKTLEAQGKELPKKMPLQKVLDRWKGKLNESEISF